MAWGAGARPESPPLPPRGSPPTSQRWRSPTAPPTTATLILTSIEGALLLAKAQHDTRALDRIHTELTRAITTALHTTAPDSKK